MTDIEAKALALLNKVGRDWGNVEMPAENINRAHDARCEALCRAVEQHEAFRQEVSDALKKYFSMDWNTHNMVSDLHRFIITKPDPLVEIMKELVLTARMTSGDLRAALEARGLEIREKGQ